MNTSKTAQSLRPGEQAKTPNDLDDPFEHRHIFNKFDLEIDHVKHHHFTESDKRKVLEGKYFKYLKVLKLCGKLLIFNL